jgi:single-strand DNA-binding protein
MPDTLTITGLVATTPRHLVTSEGLPITSFRLASTQRRYDRGKGSWIDAETNWYTVTCFRQLAINVVASIAKGQRVLVSGRLRVRDWQSGDRAGTTVEIDADAVGHDLAWGTSVYTRSVASTVAHDADLPSSTRPRTGRVSATPARGRMTMPTARPDRRVPSRRRFRSRRSPSRAPRYTS